MMAVSTRRIDRSEPSDSQNDQQDNGTGVGSTQGPTESSDNTENQDGEVDVHRLMGLHEMQKNKRGSLVIHGDSYISRGNI